MSAALEKKATSGQPDLCTVVVIYDDSASRTRALQACDYLLRQEWENVELDFHWWRTDFLSDPHMGRAAARHAIASDIVIVCSREGNGIPPILGAWFESWIDGRKNHEGAMIDLGATRTATRPAHRLTLQAIAQRGGFDYLTATPEQPGSDFLKSAPPMSSPTRMDDRPAPSHPPSHYGLNE